MHHKTKRRLTNLFADLLVRDDSSEDEEIVNVAATAMNGFDSLTFSAQAGQAGHEDQPESWIWGLKILEAKILTLNLKVVAMMTCQTITITASAVGLKIPKCQHADTH